MNIDQLTVAQIRTIHSMFPAASKSIETIPDFPYVVGSRVLIRTVTMIYTGAIKDVYENELVLKDACWIASTGRWADSLKSCEFDEVEPYLNDVIIGRGGILDVTEIETLPSKQK